MISIDSLIVFIVVGAIVSLDVTALTLAKSPSFTQENRKTHWWACLNGLWHAGLLAIYILVISGILVISIDLIVPLKDFINKILRYFELGIGVYFAYFLDGIAFHAQVILGLVAVGLVWIIYSEKIRSVPALGDERQLTTLPRLAYNLVEIVVSPFMSPDKCRVFMHWNAQAALVAVDMLALAMIVKAGNYINSTANQIALVASVFFVVTIFALVSGQIGSIKYRKFYEEQSAKWFSNSEASFSAKWVLVTLRLIEPLLIFYFVLQLLGFIITDRVSHDIGFMFGAILLLFSLIAKHGFNNIVLYSLQGLEPEQSSKKTEDASKIYDALKNLSKLIWKIGSRIVFAMLVVVVFVAAIAYFDRFLLAVDSPVKLLSKNPSQSVTGAFEPSLESTISKFVAAISTFIILFHALVPDKSYFRHISRMTNRLCNLVLLFLFENCVVFFFFLMAVFVASVVPIFDELSLTVARILRSAKENQPFSLAEIGLKWNHVHAIQFSIWFLYLSLYGLMLRYIYWVHCTKIERVNILYVRLSSDSVRGREAELTNKLPSPGFLTVLLFLLSWGLVAVGEIQDLVLTQFSKEVPY